MNKLINISIVLLFTVFFASCENDIDNYDAPNGGIRGVILDKETNEPIPLPVQGGSGVIINLFEQNTGASKSVDFRAKQDGSYENTQVFNADYKVVVNGPFVEPCEGLVTIKGQTEFNLSATPYSRVSIQASVDTNNKLTISYNAVPSNNTYTISEISVMWNFAPGVDINTSNYATKAVLNSASGSHIFDLPNDSEFKNNHYKIVANNNKIYVRVAAKTENRINYSPVTELIVN